MIFAQWESISQCWCGVVALLNGEINLKLNKKDNFNLPFSKPSSLLKQCFQIPSCSIIDSALWIGWWTTLGLKSAWIQSNWLGYFFVGAGLVFCSVLFDSSQRTSSPTQLKMGSISLLIFIINYFWSILKHETQNNSETLQVWYPLQKDVCQLVGKMNFSIKLRFKEEKRHWFLIRSPIQSDTQLEDCVMLTLLHLHRLVHMIMTLEKMKRWD